MRFLKPSSIIFCNDALEKEYYKLDENSEIKKSIKRAITDIQINAYVGIQLPKRLIPKIYIQKYGINNLWKYDLPNGWRLVYSITTPNKIEILAIILEWFDHSDYERRFHY
jgi:Txe/YoeB family toxin of Txe-Axe toxin-antitoxin module